MVRLFPGWSRRDIPVLCGRRALVTGANSGIGFEVARQLTEKGCEVILVGRDEQLLKWAARDLEEEFPGAHPDARVADMEDPKQVDALAQSIIDAKIPLNILVNCAGRYLDAPFSLIPSGFEATLAANYFGHAQLTMLLLDRIAASGPGARIINVSSPAEQYGRVDLTDIKGEKLGTSGMPAYGRSKLFQIMFNHELQRRLRLAGIKNVDCFAVHPGLVATGLSNKVQLSYPAGALSYAAMVLSGQSPLQGAQSSLYAATAPELSGQGGAFIGPQYATNMFHAHKRFPTNPAVYDYDARIELFEKTLEALEDAAGHRLPTLPREGRPIPACC